MVDHLVEESLIGGYEAAAKHRKRVLETYESIAQLIGAASSSEIAIVENATVAWQQALGAVPLQAGDVVVCSTAEYHANYIPLLQLMRRVGISTVVVPEDADGALDVAALEVILQQQKSVRLIALTYIPSNGGLVNPAAAVGMLARRYGVLFLLDACQAVGQMPIDVAALGCDMLCATARKFLRGPRGIGFLWVRQDSLARLAEPHMLDGYSARWVAPDQYEVAEGAQRFENWEFNIAAVLAMGAAVDYALQVGLERIWTRVRHLAALLRRLLSAIPGVDVQDKGREQCSIVSFTVAGAPAEAVKAFLAEQRVNISYSTAQAAMLEMHARGLGEVCRASVHYFNTEEELHRVTELVGDFARANI
eukprot:GGOE01014340.1.p1 GENE.GGOE01014340.1~~GGOE01014340.1.p1  ORF type:complete len:421 (+),score=101.64 GGOE01014340.1:173-1264(+)